MTNSSLLKWGLCGLVAMAAGAAGAQITKQGNAYLFRMKFKPGHSTTYAVSSTGLIGGQGFSSFQTMTQKVLKLVGGMATVEATLSDVKVTVAGKTSTQAMPANMKQVTVEMDSKGNAKGGSGLEQTSIALPEKPIAVGATWTTTNTLPGAGGQGMQVSATYKFAGIQSVGGVRAAKITMTVKGTGRMTITGTGTNWLSVADGSLIKSDASMTMMGFPVSVVVTRK